MATTEKGIYYPDDYTKPADVPEDMKKLAESVDTQISNLDTNKVDKVNGKGLSTNDYTNEDKAKLDSLENYDDTEIKQDIEDIQTKDEAQDTEIDKQSDLIQKLKDNCINVTTDEATQLQVQDASTLPAKLDVRGNHSQETREGYNIWDYLSAVLSSAGGLTIEKDYENGYITVNGMPSKDYVSIVSTAYITNLLEDGQRYTLWQENYQNEETAGIYLQVARTDDNGTTRYYSLSNSATFLVDKSNNASYSIILQTSTVANTKTLSNYKNRYMLYKGTEDKTYELPGASPSLDYPSEIEAVGDNVNLFDGEIEEGGYDVNGEKVAAGNTVRNKNFIDIGNYKTVIFSNNGSGIAVNIYEYDKDYTFIKYTNAHASNKTFNKTSTTKYINFSRGNTNVDKIKIEPGETITSYSPYGQGSVEVKKINKNFYKLDIEGVSRSGVDYTTRNGTVTAKRTATAESGSYFNTNRTKLPAGTYVISGVDDTFVYANARIEVYTSDTIDGNATQITTLMNTRLSYKYTSDKPFYLSFSFVVTGETDVNDTFIFKPQAEKNDNDTASTFVEHQEQSYVLPIQQPMLKGDYFAKETDGWKEVHTFGYVNTREVENLGVSLNTSNGEFRRYNAYNLVTDRKSGEYLKILCTHFKRTDSRWHENEGICGWETGQSFCIGTFNTNYDTVDRMKTFLQNNDVGIYYELATPTKLACTEAQSTVLNQFSELPLFKGTNNIITAESLALLQMSYIADTQSYIDNRIDEKLTNINQQILNIVGGN